MKRWLVIGTVGLAALAAGIALVLGLPPGSTFVERHGSTLIIHGRGSEADLGYLAAGRYRLTIDQNDGGCADSVTLVGQDGVRWFQVDLHDINYQDFDTTPSLPGQHYWMSVLTFFRGGGLGPPPTATPTPASECTWVFELARISSN